MLVTYGFLFVEKFAWLIEAISPHAFNGKQKKIYIVITRRSKGGCIAFFKNYLYHYQNKIEILNYQII